MRRITMKNYEKKLGRRIDQLAEKARIVTQEASAKAHQVTKATNGKARSLARRTGEKLENAGKKIKSLLN
jgi:hypothetical protein